MQPLKHIRTKIFQASQAEFAQITGAAQPTVSRWERGELEPSREEMSRIRAAAEQRGLPWNDLWFFETPRGAEQSEGAAA